LIIVLRQKLALRQRRKKFSSFSNFNSSRPISRPLVSRCFFSSFRVDCKGYLYFNISLLSFVFLLFIFCSAAQLKGGYFLLYSVLYKSVGFCFCLFLCLIVSDENDNRLGNAWKPKMSPHNPILIYFSSNLSFSLAII